MVLAIMQERLLQCGEGTAFSYQGLLMEKKILLLKGSGCLVTGYKLLL